MIRLNGKLFKTYCPPIAIGNDFVFNLRDNRFIYIKDFKVGSDNSLKVPRDSESLNIFMQEYCFCKVESGWHWDTSMMYLYLPRKEELLEINKKWLVFYDNGQIFCYNTKGVLVKRIGIPVNFGIRYGFIKSITDDLFVVLLSSQTRSYYYCFLDVKEGNILYQKSITTGGNYNFIRFLFNDYCFVKDDKLHILMPYIYQEDIHGCYIRNRYGENEYYCHHSINILHLEFDLNKQENKEHNHRLQTYTNEIQDYISEYNNHMGRFDANWMIFQKHPTDNNKLILYFRDFDGSKDLISYVEYDYVSHSCGSKNVVPDNYQIKSFLCPFVDKKGYYPTYYEGYEYYIVPNIRVFPIGNNTFMVAVTRVYEVIDKYATDSFLGKTTIALIQINPSTKEFSLLHGFYTTDSSLFGRKYLRAITRITDNNFILLLSDSKTMSPFYIAEMSINPKTFEINVNFLKEYNNIKPYSLTSFHSSQDGKKWVIIKTGNGNVVDVYASGMAEKLVVSLSKKQSQEFPYETDLTVEALDLFNDSSYAEVLVRLISNNIEFKDGTSEKIVKVYPHQSTTLPVVVKHSGKVKISAEIINTVL